MSASRKPTNGKRTKVGTVKSWIPSKFQDGAAQLLNPPPDPWGEPPPLRWENGQPVPVQARPQREHDLWSHWEWVLQNEHFHEFPHRPGAPRERRCSFERAKPFWKTLQTCEILRKLCAEKPSRAVHAVIAYLYECIHRHRVDALSRPTGPPAVSNKALRARRVRYWSRVSNHFRELITIVDDIPEDAKDALPPRDRAKIRAILQAASERAAKLCKHPPRPPDRTRILQITPEGKETMITIEAPQEWGKSRRPRGKGDSLNVDLAILVDLVREATKRRHHWRIAAELLKHFHPEEFLASFDEENLKPRVLGFRRRTKGATREIETKKASFLQNIIGSCFPCPDFLPADHA